MKFKKSAVFLCALFILSALVTLSSFLAFSALGANETVSGYCGAEGDGKNVSWSFEESTGELKISGSGAMANYNSTAKPWYHLKDEVKSITISAGVTTVSDYGFSDFSRLKSLSLPDSIKSIGRSAFENCTQLEVALTIPAKVEHIYQNAFASCKSLVSLVIEEGEAPLFIASGAFEGCIGLSGTLTIPGRVTQLSYNAFRGCTKLAALTVNRGIKEIGDGAFQGCTSFANALVLPDSLEKIDSYAFEECSFSSVTLSGELEIKSFAFNKCKKMSELILNIGIKNIGRCAFMDCSALEAVNIPGSVYTVEDSCFMGCVSLTSLGIGEGVSDIKSDAFSGCAKLNSLIIPSSVTSIADGAFSGCTGLTSISVDDDNNVYADYGNCLIDISKRRLLIGCDNSTITENGTVLTIAPYAFAERSLTGTLKIPASVVKIGDYAFQNCIGINKLVFEGGGEISTGAFYGCTGISGQVAFSDKVTLIGTYAFNGCTGITGLAFEEGIVGLYSEAFSECGAIEGTIKLPISLMELSCDAFKGNSGIERVIFENPEASVLGSDYVVKKTTIIEAFENSNVAKWAGEHSQTLETRGSPKIDLLKLENKEVRYYMQKRKGNDNTFDYRITALVGESLLSSFLEAPSLSVKFENGEEYTLSLSRYNCLDVHDNSGTLSFITCEDGCFMLVCIINGVKDNCGILPGDVALR